MSAESEKLYVKMDVDMKAFDSAVDEMNEKLKKLRSAIITAQNSFDARRKKTSSSSASDIIRDAISGIETNVTEGTSESETSEAVFDSSKYGVSFGSSKSGAAKYINTQEDTASLIKREVENEFARQAAKLARI